MLNQIRPAVVTFAMLTVLTGVIYPAVVTGVAKVAFADKAGGSLIVRDGRPAGSALIGQSFTDAKYFRPRPSAANYDGAAGSGSNLGPTNPALVEAVSARVQSYRPESPSGVVPADLVTASGSGLDPHISPAAAELQIPAVAKARGMSEEAVRQAVAECTLGRTFGLLGQPRVNVLRLNLLLDNGGPDAEPLSGHASAFGRRGRAFLPATH